MRDNSQFYRTYIVISPSYIFCLEFLMNLFQVNSVLEILFTRIHFYSLVKTYEVCPEGIQPCAMKNRDIY